MLILKRFKNKKERTRCITIVVTLSLLVAIIISCSILYNNASSSMINNFNKDNGKSDIIIYGNSDKIDNSEKLVKNNINDSCLISISNSYIFSKKNEKKIPVLIGSANLKLINDFYNIDIKQSDSIKPNTCIISEKLSTELNINAGNDLIISGNDNKKINFKVLKISDFSNILGSNNEFILISGNNQLNLISNLKAALFYCGHNEKNVNLVKTELNKQDVNISVPFDNIKSIFNELNNLMFSIQIFIFIVVIISVALVFITYNTTALERMKYWGLLRTIGLKKNYMIKMMVLEMLILGAIGLVIGIFTGILAGNGLSILSGIKIYSIYPIAFYCILSAIIAMVIPTLSALIISRKIINLLPLEMLFQIKEKKAAFRNQRFILSRAIIGLLILIYCLIIAIFFNRRISIVFNAFQMLMCLFSIFLLSIPITIFIIKFLKKCKSSLLNISLTNILSDINKCKSIMITTILIIVLINMTIGFIITFQNEAVNMADQQIKYDYLITFNNEKKNIDKLHEISNSNNMNILSLAYLNIGKVRGSSVYIYQSGISNLKKTYNNKLFSNNLSNDSIVVSKILADEKNLKAGDSIEISVENEIKTLKVTTILDSYDFNGLAVFVPNETFKNKNFSKVYVYGKYNNQNVSDDLKKEAVNSSFTFLSLNDIKNKWKSSIVNGIKPVKYLLIVISIAALLLICNNAAVIVKEKRQDFILLRSIGMRRNESFWCLLFEFIFIQTIAVILGIIYSLLINQYFCNIQNLMSSQQVIKTIPIVLFSITGLLVIILTTIFEALTIIRNTKSELILQEND